MKTHNRLPGTPLEVSPLCLGSWSLAGGFNWGPQDSKQSIATIHAALDMGINFLDTAPLYGDGLAEQLIGEALADRQEKETILATKVSFKELDKAALVKSCETSLRRLKRDCIDLLQLHWPNRDIPFPETIEGLELLKQQGKIRFYGVCNFGVRDLENWISAGGQPVTNQIPYSLLWRAIEFEIAPKCMEEQIGILAYSPLMQGLLSGKFTGPEDVPVERARTRHFSSKWEHTRHGEPGAEQETFEALESMKSLCENADCTMTQAALYWLCNQPGMVAPIIGPRSPAQLEASLEFLSLSPPDSFLEQLDELTRPLKHSLGSNPDPWESPGRF